MQINKKYILALVCIFCFMQSILSASGTDSIYCLSAIKHFERKYKIPKNFLYLISLVESGKWDRSSKKLQPWPWAANIGGKSKFFKNKKEMVASLKKHIAAGQENIDIGCTQVNYKYHKQHFNSIEEMITPYYNVGYSAYYLSQKFSKAGSWNDAIALYHSKNSRHNGRYIKKIEKTAKLDSNLRIALNNTTRSLNTYATNKKDYKKFIPKQNSYTNIMVYDINNANIISEDVIKISKKWR